MRPQPITPSDFKLRIFLDANILIDYAEGLADNKSKLFIDSYLGRTDSNIELVTSNFVLWELYQFLRKEKYIKEMMQKGWCASRALKRSSNFGDWGLEDFKKMFTPLKDQVHDLISRVNIERTFDPQGDMFHELVEKLLFFSKVSIEDILVLCSALSMGLKPQVFLTRDREFRTEVNRKSELEEFLKELPILIPIRFIAPDEVYLPSQLNGFYEKWFTEGVRDRMLGVVFKFWPEIGVVGIKCLGSYTVKTGDYLRLVKFRDGILLSTTLRADGGNLKDFDTGKSIEEGSTVTIKLPSDASCESWMQDASVFLFQDSF